MSANNNVKVCIDKNDLLKLLTETDSKHHSINRRYFGLFHPCSFMTIQLQIIFEFVFQDENVALHIVFCIENFEWRK